MADKIELPIVKISFIRHNRQYEVGIKHFLEKLNVKASDDEIMIAVRYILSEQ